MNRDPIVEAVVAARVSLLFDDPFYGYLITRLQLTEASEACETASSDGRRFFYNRQFIQSLTPNELQTLMKRIGLDLAHGQLGPNEFTDAERHSIRSEVRAAAIHAAETIGAARVPDSVKTLLAASSTARTVSSTPTVTTKRLPSTVRMKVSQ